MDHVHSVSGTAIHRDDGDRGTSGLAANRNGPFVFDVALSDMSLDIADTALPGMTTTFLE